VANTLYPKTKQKIGTAQINLATAVVKAALVGPGYVANLATDEFFTTISAHVLGVPQTLTQTLTLGVFDAGDVTIPAIAPGSTISAIVLYVDTGVAGTSSLLAYIHEVTGLPAVTSGAGYTIPWDNGTNKIFAL
jgi:hypothetical protein